MIIVIIVITIVVLKVRIGTRAWMGVRMWMKIACVRICLIIFVFVLVWLI